jgi:hypothetical protein
MSFSLRGNKHFYLLGYQYEVQQFNSRNGRSVTRGVESEIVYTQAHL